jgi:hypothetical protein
MFHSHEESAGKSLYDINPHWVNDLQYEINNYNITSTIMHGFGWEFSHELKQRQDQFEKNILDEKDKIIGKTKGIHCCTLIELKTRKLCSKIAEFYLTRASRDHGGYMVHLAQNFRAVYNAYGYYLHVPKIMFKCGIYYDIQNIINDYVGDWENINEILYRPSDPTFVFHFMFKKIFDPLKHDEQYLLQNDLIFNSKYFFDKLRFAEAYDPCTCCFNYATARCKYHLKCNEEWMTWNEEYSCVDYITPSPLDCVVHNPMYHLELDSNTDELSNEYVSSDDEEIICNVWCFSSINKPNNT